MRILFDKNVPYPLLRYVEKHDVRTAEERGWAQLVDAAREGGYEFVRFELPPKRKPGGTAA